ncbi:nuclear transport factor 2 family protein [Amycolatopsis rubida]|uniref:Nuclear transport factor 2 family protein n=1 Tax=Amycolatopsis rubida TaxID=112413 RepID=A0A1I5ZFA5_9PSEU|nr:MULTISPECIES: nuclear transport factor 2 family protein [Amycolatopsis]MYW92953.1 nuclear transport factor 2 family protein [Amycolatopsis rubida]NEC57940.1 nuclear transport factor 2 family protein [Amycolatopsis rubida]OAP25477.1 SnoaL-like domain protein [Amycolatopsis sp. M39]SFQ55100.1 SnoaL-like domain-containing protein [Amycolatopsis rubida]
MRAAEKRALIDRYVRAYNEFDINGMLSTLTPDIRFENHSDRQLTVGSDGVEAFRQLAEQSAALFAEREQRVLSIGLHPAGATAQVAYRGVPAAPVPGDDRSGKVIELKGTTEFSFENGKIAKIVDRS